MSSDPYPLNFWEPGWTGVYGGVMYRTVTSDSIPRRAIEYIKRQQLRTGFVWAVGMRNATGWTYVSSPNEFWWKSGDATIGKADHTVCIPLEFFDEENEFGPVSP